MTVASPSPVPFPISFVVKNGSNVAPHPAGMPVSGAASEDDGAAAAGFHLDAAADENIRLALSLRSSGVPPSGIASLALTARLRRTCSSWAGSATTEGSAVVSSLASMSSPIRRAEHLLDVDDDLVQVQPRAAAPAGG